MCIRDRSPDRTTYMSMAGLLSLVGACLLYTSARLADICRGAQVELTREEWYAVYLAAGNTLP